MAFKIKGYKVLLFEFTFQEILLNNSKTTFLSLTGTFEKSKSMRALSFSLSRFYKFGSS